VILGFLTFGSWDMGFRSVAWDGMGKLLLGISAILVL
jgi:hypothetical protein